MGTYSVAVHGTIDRPKALFSILESPDTTAFSAKLDRIIGTLGGLRLRVSLFAISVRGWPGWLTAELAEEALGHLGFSGMLPDGATGFFYIGPRTPGKTGDAALERRIAHHMHATLAWHGIDDAADSLEVRVVHGWADEVQEARMLLRALASYRDQQNTTRLWLDRARFPQARDPETRPQ